jgi:hypothetical protein
MRSRMPASRATRPSRSRPPLPGSSKASFDANVQGVETSLKSAMWQVETSLKSDITRVEALLKADVAAVGADLRTRPH